MVEKLSNGSETMQESSGTIKHLKYIAIHNLFVCTMAAPFSYSRTVVDFKTGDTPMHLACAGNQPEALSLMVEEANRVHLAEGDTTPVYNQRNRMGKSPVFLTNSPKIVQIFLQYDDLDARSKSGTTLLWKCAERGIVSEEIASHPTLREALGVRCFSRLPLEEGKVLQLFAKVISRQS